MTDTIKFHKLIGDELVPLEMIQKRFEQTVERIDKDVDNGASKAQILEKYSDYIVNSGKAAIAKKPKSTEKASSETADLKPKEKQEIVQTAIADNPSMTLGEIAKHVEAQGHMTRANARYLAAKFMK